MNKKGPGRWAPVLAGIALACPALWLVTAVLMDADAVFALVAGDALSWLDQRFGVVLLRLVLALCAAPFLFSLLYFASHTDRKERGEKVKREWEALPWTGCTSLFWRSSPPPSLGTGLICSGRGSASRRMPAAASSSWWVWRD